MPLLSVNPVQKENAFTCPGEAITSSTLLYETILLTVSLDTRPLFTRRRSRARLYSDQISDPRWFLLSLFCVNTHT